MDIRSSGEFTFVKNNHRIVDIIVFSSVCPQKRGLKGVFAKNERGYRLNAIKKRF